MTSRSYYIGESNIDGQGVFTNKIIDKGEPIGIAINYSLGFIPYVTSEFGSYINHSWKPNSKLVYSYKDGVYYVRAIKTLLPDTEITLDYRDTPWYIEGPKSWYR